MEMSNNVVSLGISSMNKIDGIYCRDCGKDITKGYSRNGRCVVCDEKHHENPCPNLIKSLRKAHNPIESDK